MGRKKKEEALKKKTISVTLDVDVLMRLEELKPNKSKLINSLIKKYLHED